MEAIIDSWDLAPLLARLDEQIPTAVALREAIHREPHISGHEGPTADAVMAALGVDDFEVVAETGRLVRIGPKTGPAIAIRAELDALPIKEESGVAFASQNENMHACGHDLHIAGAVALARAAMDAQLPVALVFMFQPREEAYPSGARDFIESGLLAEHDVRTVIGLHVHPGVSVGAITTGAGIVNAAADEFSLTVSGSGGHAAYPHLTTDPIVALAQVISVAQTIVSRRIDPMHPAVLSFGSLAAGSAANVIASSAVATGSIRSTWESDRELIFRQLERITEHVAEANNCVGAVEITLGEPILSNDACLVDHVDARLSAGGFDVVEPMRSCGADDFSYFSEAFTSIMMFLGVGSHREGLSLHSPDFCPDNSFVRSVGEAFAIAYAGALDELAARTE